MFLPPISQMVRHLPDRDGTRARSPPALPNVSLRRHTPRHAHRTRNPFRVSSSDDDGALPLSEEKSDQNHQERRSVTAFITAFTWRGGRRW